MKSQGVLTFVENIFICTELSLFLLVSSFVAQDGYDDCIDQVGSAKYVSKFDPLKGYRQVPLTSQAGETAAFATSTGPYSYLL